MSLQYNLDLNLDRATAWADALRSGSYAQGHSALRDEGRFCSLGVLCDISGVGLWLPLTESASGLYTYETGVFAENLRLRSEASLPSEVRAWLGADSILVQLEPNSFITAFYCNDVLRYSFEQIADLVEQERDRVAALIA